MSQPPSYTPNHSFVSDSATLANFPGQALDVEFAEIKIVTDAIEANLKLIQRDDGNLANGTVGYDQLSAVLQLNGIASASAWLTGVAYAVGAAVTQSQNLYRCVVAHTSGTFATDLAAGKWAFVVGVGNLSGPATSVVGNLPTFSDTVGRNLADSGVALTSLAPLASPLFTGAVTITSTTASAFAVGANGATNPVLSVDASAASQTSGVSIRGNAAGGGVSISVTDSASNSPLAINALGSGTITLGNGSTGNIVLSRALNYGGVTLNNAVTGTGNMVLSASPTLSGSLTIGSTSAFALAVGTNGATNPVLAVDASAASQASGLSVKGNAAGGGTSVSVIDSASNSPLSINALGTGTITLGNASTGNIVLSRALNYGGVTLNNAVTGTGNMVLSTSPVLTTPNLGTPSAVNLSNGTSLPATSLTGTLQAAQEPAHTGDMTNTAGSLATTVTKINGVDQTAAWTTYTPTISAQSGTITTSSATGRYKQIGKTILLEVDVTITTAGTGAGGLQATVPITAATNNYVGASREIATTGKAGGTAINSATPTFVDMRDATGATYIASGARVAGGLTYEIP